MWGGASLAVTENIDRIQKRAIKYGIVKDYVPIRKLIEVADSRLYRKIEKEEDNPLKRILPHREEYATCRLRARKPTGTGKTERELKIFPNRHLRKHYYLTKT